jgi:hypothetical protein
LGRNADMIECFFHLNLRLWSRALGATENAESTEKLIFLGSMFSGFRWRLSPPIASNNRWARISPLL